MPDDGERWNHSIHYFPVLLSALPAGATRALDVGCGEGVLTRRLRAVVPHVVGIDVDEPSLTLARGVDGGDGIEYVHGDFLTHTFEPSSFDFVAVVAVLHHMDADAALARMGALLRPGGSLGIIGLARSRLPRDVPREIRAAVATRVLKRSGGRRHWETPAPKIWPPPRTYDAERALLERALPGVRFHREVLWRYIATWTKPRESAANPTAR